MGNDELEQLAVQIYRDYHLNPVQPASPVELAKRITWHHDPLEWADWLTKSNAALFRHGKRYRIALKRGLSVPCAMFAICHELAHAALERRGYRPAQLEPACDYLAACLLAPRPATRAFVQGAGLDAPKFALVAASSETWAALRFGEALDLPTIVKSPKQKRYRNGAEHLALMNHALDRDLPMPGTVRIRIKDQAGRSALLRAG